MVSTENLPTDKATMLSPAASTNETDQQNEAENSRRNAEFDRKMQALNEASNKDVIDQNLDMNGYMRNMAEREKQEYAELQKWRDDPSLSENQRAELDSRLKMIDYSRDTQQIMDAYMKDPSNEEAKQKYDAREAELKSYRELMQNSEEFGKSESMAKMRQLEDKLEAIDSMAAGSMEAKTAVKMEMAEVMRDFKRELLADPDGMEKILKFVEKNKDNAVVQKTGMDKMAEVLRERRAEKGEDKEESLENAKITPNGVAKAGAVSGRDGISADAAEKEVAATQDDGNRGRIDPVRMEAQEASDVRVNAGGPGQQRENSVGGLA